MNSDIIMPGFGRVAHDAYPLPVEGGPDDASTEAKRPVVCIRRVEPQTPSVDATGKTPGQTAFEAFTQTAVMRLFNSFGRPLEWSGMSKDGKEEWGSIAKAVLDAFGDQPSAEVLHQERLDLLEQMFERARLHAKYAVSHADMLPQEVGFEIAMATYREWLSMARGRCGVP